VARHIIGTTCKDAITIDTAQHPIPYHEVIDFADECTFGIHVHLYSAYQAACFREL
jgi:hypothetical protein